MSNTVVFTCTTYNNIQYLSVFFPEDFLFFLQRKTDYVAAITGEDYVRLYRSVDGYIHGELAYLNIFVTF
jgi:hypothetical protein